MNLLFETEYDIFLGLKICFKNGTDLTERSLLNSFGLPILRLLFFSVGCTVSLCRGHHVPLRPLLREISLHW